MMKKSIVRLTAATLVGAGILAAAALPSQAAGFEAYKYTGYGTIIMDAATDAGYYDVADDRTSSAKNFNSRFYYGRSYTGWGDANEVVFTFSEYTDYSTLYTANNTIDFFYYK